MSKSKRVSSILAVAFCCAALASAALATGAAAAIRHFDGTVLSKSASAKTVTVRTEGGSKITFKVNASTDFERINGFGGLAKGMQIEIDAVNSNGTWTARQIETQGGSGGDDNSGGDDHGGGHDDGPNHT